MRARSFMFPHQLLALGAVLVLASACGTRVVNGIGTGGTGTTSTTTVSSVSTGTSQGTGGAPTVTVSTGTSVGGNTAVGGGGPGYLEMAIRWADLPPINTNSGTTVASSTGSSGGPDPDAVELLISDQAINCGPNFWNLPCDSWRVNMLVPPQLLVVGMPVSFSELMTTYSETGSSASMDCGGSSAASGGPGPGTFEVLALDAQTVTYRLTGVNVGVAVDINGDHVATRCVP